MSFFKDGGIRGQIKISADNVTLQLPTLWMQIAWLEWKKDNLVSSKLHKFVHIFLHKISSIRLSFSVFITKEIVSI